MREKQHGAVTDRRRIMTQQANPPETSAAPLPPTRPAAAPATAGAAPVQRQFVNFAFFKLDPAFRRLGDHEKIQARSEFLDLFQQKRPGLMCLTYSTIGLRP